MSIKPFGWINKAKPALDAQNLEQDRLEIGEYADHDMAVAETNSTAAAKALVEAAVNTNLKNLGKVSGTVKLKLNEASCFTAELVGTTTFVVEGAPSRPVNVELIVSQDPTGGRSWSITGITWFGPEIPVFKVTPGLVYLIQLLSVEAGAKLYGLAAGQGAVKEEVPAVIIGTNTGGPSLSSSKAKVLQAAGIRASRANMESGSENLKPQLEQGFTNPTITIGNVPNETKLSEVNQTTWVARAIVECEKVVTLMEAFPTAFAGGVAICEVMNESWLKGPGNTGPPQPKYYAEMFYLLHTELISKKGEAFRNKLLLLFNAHGEYSNPSQKAKAVLTAGSHKFTFTEATGPITVSSTVSGTGIPGGSVVESVVGNEVEMSAAVEAGKSGTVTVTTTERFSHIKSESTAKVITWQGWIGDCLFFKPELKNAGVINGWSGHPYGKPKTSSEGNVGAEGAKEQHAGIIGLAFPNTGFYITEFGFTLPGSSSPTLRLASEAERIALTKQTLEELTREGWLKGFWWYEAQDETTVQEWGLFEGSSETLRPLAATIAAF